jgi:two-component system, OmpR family, sensor kinase
MMRRHSLRFRMMLLFSTVVGVLLAASYLAFYVLLAREVHSQLDRQLLDVSRPIIADISTDPDEQDVSELNLPDEYFEVLDASGRVLQHSENLASRALGLGGRLAGASTTVFRTIEDPERGRLRLGIIPFRAKGPTHLMVVAMSTRDADEVLGRYRQMILVLLPLSLLATGLVSAWYAERSLRPVAELTRHAEQMSARVSDPESAKAWEPLAVANPHDELGRLAVSFNRLFARVSAALGQLRQFVSDASHEMRTPLAVLQGETELLLSQPRSRAEYQRALAVLHDELKMLSRMVEGLFTLAMADAGQLRLARDPLYLNEVLEESCLCVAPLARAKQIQIESELKQEVAYVGDETLLRELFMIFLDNAVKYSPGGTRVRVNLEQADSVIRASFEDQGIGISAEDLPHVFERFYRAAPPLSGDAHSGGLGLAIAQAIVGALGGSIECVSAPAKGSTFTVRLPYRPSRTPPPEGAATPARPS